MSLASYTFIFYGIGWTIAITVISFVTGMVLGFPIALARMSRYRSLGLIMDVALTLVRSVPPLVWLFLVFFGIGSSQIKLSPFLASIVVFGIISAVYMAEIYRGSIRSIDAGQTEAASALGLTKFHLYRDIIIPQMAKISLPPSATYLIGLLKNTSIASTIGVMEVTFRGVIVSERTFSGLDVFIYVGLIYILLSLPIAALSRLLDARLRAHQYIRSSDAGGV